MNKYEEIVAIIQRVHPDLFDFMHVGGEQYKMKFKYAGVTDDVLILRDTEHQVFRTTSKSTNIITAFIDTEDMESDRQIYFELTYNINDHHDCMGVLIMDWDYGLCDDTCAWLFGMGIDIRFKRESINNSRFHGVVSYDKEAIMRRHTIKNIVNG